MHLPCLADLHHEVGINYLSEAWWCSKCNACDCTTRKQHSSTTPVRTAARLRQKFDKAPFSSAWSLYVCSWVPKRMHDTTPTKGKPPLLSSLLMSITSLPSSLPLFLPLTRSDHSPRSPDITLIIWQLRGGGLNKKQLSGEGRGAKP